MKMMMRLVPVAAVLLMAGCKTTEETKPVSWAQQSVYLGKVKDPRYYGYSIYQTPAGIDYRGGSRLHSSQMAELTMDAENPLRPVGALRGQFGLESPLLFDFTASHSWLEFDLAQSLGARPISEGNAQLVKMPGDEVLGCLSVVPTLRLGQLYVENPLVYVRMANGSLGSLTRGIDKPALKGVVGWDLLKQFDQIHLDYPGKRMVLLAESDGYNPNPAMVVATVPLMKHAGACVMRGTVDGHPGMILLDPAGDFDVATDAAAPVSLLQLADGLVFSSPGVAESPGGVRIGARLLQNYNVTICPKAGLIYFETSMPGAPE
jgi:hypothetical protein